MAKRSCQLEFEMTNFTSDIKIIPHGRQQIYDVLSNMENLEKVKDRIPQHKVQEFSFDQDSCSFSVPPVGQLRVVIVERDAPEIIRLAVANAPIEASLFVRLIPENENETQVQLTVEANLNPVLMSMVSKPLQEGMNKIADFLTVIPYNEL